MNASPLSRLSSSTRRGSSHSLPLAVATAALLVIGLISALLVPSPAGASVPARTSTEASWGAAVARVLNSERAANHLRALTMRPQLMASARNHDLAMARTNTMAHQVSGERPLGARISATGYHWTWAGENIGWNSAISQAGVLQLQTMMYGERPPNDGHRLNILNSHYTDVGVDVYIDRTHHKVWLTVDFGRG